MVYTVWVFLTKDNDLRANPVLGTSIKRYEACRMYNNLVALSHKVQVLKGRQGKLNSYEVVSPKDLEDKNNKIIPADLLLRMAGVVEDPVSWFHTPNHNIGNLRPIDMSEARLENWITSIEAGMFS